MRLLEIDRDYVTLYRGDSTQIGKFDVRRTDSLALFGQGIYLTDSKRVARDYTAKGDAKDVLFRYRGRGRKDEAIEAFIRRMARYRFNPDGSKKSFADPPSEISYIDVDGHSKQKEGQQALAHATAEWERMKKDVEVRVQLDKDVIIRKKQRPNTVTEFRMPRRVIDKMLDAEAPIDQDVLDVLLSSLRRHGDIKTARDVDRTVNDRFGEEDWSFRQVWTGLTADAPTATAEVQEEMRLEFLRMGYPGIVYLGGVTMGGGHRHRAYVFFDSRTVNKYRVS